MNARRGIGCVLTDVVDKAESSGTSKEESTPPVTPTESGDESWENEAHADDEVEVPLLLPLDDLVFGEIRDVGRSDGSAGLDEHPPDVRVEEALVSVVGVEVGVGVSVVGSVASGPPLDGTLDGACTEDGKEVLEGSGSIVRSVGPKSVVSCKKMGREGQRFVATEMTK